MGGSASINVANSTNAVMWIKVDSDRDYITELNVKATAEYKAVKGSVSATTKYEWTKQVPGYSPVSSGESISFDVPQGKDECWVTAYDADGNFFGGPKCFRSTNGTYFNIVMCDDHNMRKGFKNKMFRCAEGSKEYWGPFVCPGCKTQKCKDPKRSGSDGWCGKVGN